MLQQVTDGLWIHKSTFLQSNAVVVQGNGGVLLIDPGITIPELATLAKDMHDRGLPVVAGFSTHPHWDHLLWHAEFGDVPRYGTSRAASEIQTFFSSPDWKAQAARMLPADIADYIPIDDLFGQTIGLSAGTTQLPWDGPAVRVIEHPGHAVGSAALLIEESGVLVAGDMLSDILIPFLELDADDPAKDYLAALDTFEGLANDIKTFIPGHGSIGDAAEMRARIEIDRTYVQDLRDGNSSHDLRIMTSPNDDVHSWQMQQLTH